MRYMHVADSSLSFGEIARAVLQPLSVEQAEEALARDLGQDAVVFASARGALAAAVACLAEDGELELPGYTCIAVPNAAVSAGRRYRFIDVTERGLVAPGAWNAGVVVTQDTFGLPAELPEGRIVIHDASHRADRIDT